MRKKKSDIEERMQQLAEFHCGKDSFAYRHYAAGFRAAVEEFKEREQMLINETANIYQKLVKYVTYLHGRNR